MKINTFGIKYISKLKKNTIISVFVHLLVYVLMIVLAISIDDRQGKFFFKIFALLVIIVTSFLFVRALIAANNLIQEISYSNGIYTIITTSSFFKSKEYFSNQEDVFFEEKIFERNRDGSIIKRGWQIKTNNKRFFLIKEYFDEDLITILNI